MSVLPQVSLAHVRRELSDAEGIITGLDLDLDTSRLTVDNLEFTIRGRSWVDDEPYVIEFRCDDYREMPPWVEMIDPDTREAGTPHAYADCFHKHPCICARYNRKTYGDHARLHRPWQYGDWGNDPQTNHLGGMISHIWSHIHGLQGNYTGRRA